eukprot:scaffold5860_cov223-Amphora_coffeaeformis.AAC.11
MEWLPLPVTLQPLCELFRKTSSRLPPKSATNKYKSRISDAKRLPYLIIVFTTYPSSYSS